MFCSSDLGVCLKHAIAPGVDPYQDRCDKYSYNISQITTLFLDPWNPNWVNWYQIMKQVVPETTRGLRSEYT